MTETTLSLTRTPPYKYATQGITQMTNITDGTSEAEFQAQLEKVEPATFQAYATAHPHLVRLIEKARQGDLLAAREFARATGTLAAPKGASPSQIWELSKLQSGWQAA